MDYKNGKIYCLRSYQTDDIYVGSTCTTLCKRIHNHRADYKLFMNDKRRYMTSFDIMKYNDVYIELLEEYPCENKSQLHRKEGEYIRKIDCLNKKIAGRTFKEYYQDNKEEILEKHKQHYQDNRDERLEKNKQYYKDNRDERLEKNRQYYKDNRDGRLEKCKQYRQQNKEKISEKQKQHYQANKEKITEYNRQCYQNNKKKITCVCGSTVIESFLNKHQKTKKHQTYINRI